MVTRDLSNREIIRVGSAVDLGSEEKTAFNDLFDLRDVLLGLFFAGLDDLLTLAKIEEVEQAHVGLDDDVGMFPPSRFLPDEEIPDPHEDLEDVGSGWKDLVMAEKVDADDDVRTQALQGLDRHVFRHAA